MVKKQRDLLIDEPPPPHLVGQRFVYATGLRYSELGRVRAKDIHQDCYKIYHEKETWDLPFYTPVHTSLIHSYYYTPLA